MPFEIVCGSRIFALGTPLAIYGVDKDENDETGFGLVGEFAVMIVDEHRRLAKKKRGRFRLSLTDTARFEPLIRENVSEDMFIGMVERSMKGTAEVIKEAWFHKKEERLIMSTTEWQKQEKVELVRLWLRDIGRKFLLDIRQTTQVACIKKLLEEITSVPAVITGD